MDSIRLGYYKPCDDTTPCCVDGCLFGAEYIISNSDGIEKRGACAEHQRESHASEATVRDCAEGHYGASEA